jgi:hypothetical protein
MIVYDNINKKYIIINSNHGNMKTYYHDTVYKKYNISLKNKNIDYVSCIQHRMNTLYRS